MPSPSHLTQRSRDRGNSCVSTVSRFSMIGPSRSNVSRVQGNNFGISELDIMTRQRYMSCSVMSSRNPSFASLGTAVLSNPIHNNPEHSSSFELRDFITEQRKIIASFRSQPWPMQLKLEAVKGYKENISKCVPQLNTLDSFRISSRRIYVKARHRLKSFGLRFSIWRNIIKKIEGNYGTSVGSYFRLVRWICLLNFLLFVVTYGLLLTPQLASGYGLDVPKFISHNMSALSYIFDGRGYMLEYSVLFYGFYDSGQNEPYFPPPANPIPSIGFHYKLPLAYLMTIMSLFIICGIIILFSMAKQYKMVQKANIGGQFIFSWKVFASWDYAVTDPTTAKLKLKQHAIALKELLFEAREAEEEVSLRMKIRVWIIRIVTNSVILVLLSSTAYIIYLSAENSSRAGIQSFELQGTLSNVISNFFLSFQLQIVIILRNFLIPFVFQLFSMLEKFHPRTALKLHLLRMFILFFSSLYVVMISLFIVSESCERNPSVATCRCWETTLGQEMFKLMFTQTIAEVTSILGVEGMRWAVTRTSLQLFYRYGKMFSDLVGPAEFDISLSVLKLVYGQGLILFGVFFCPILPGIGFAKNVIIFYFRTLAVMVFNKPPRVYFQVASTHNFYMAVLLVTVFLCALPVGYAIVEIRPSTRCGPFRGLESMFQIIPNEIAQWPEIIQTLLNYAQTATVVIPVICILLIAIYYYTALATSLREFNKDLVLQLRVEQSETRRRIAQVLTKADSGSDNTSKSRTIAGQKNRRVSPTVWSSSSSSTESSSYTSTTSGFTVSTAAPRPSQAAGTKSPLLLTKSNIEKAKL